jgi:integrase
VLTLDQLYALVDLMPDRWKAFILPKTFASLRWGEITALTRNDLDLERRTVRIRRQFLTMPGGLQLRPPKSRAGLRMVSFPAAILPELQQHLDTYALDGPDGLVFVNERGQPWHRGNFNPAVHWRDARKRIGVPNLHLQDLRHTGNTLAAQSGASPRDLMTHMGHDSPAAALIYQHSSRVADEAIAAALDTRLSERKSRPLRNVVGPVAGPTEPQLIAVEPGR